MNHNGIQYRNFKKEDYEGSLNLVLEAWRYYEWVPQKAVRPMGSYYFAEMLAASDRIWIAEENGMPIGIAAVKNKRKHTNRLNFKLRQIWAFFEIMFCGQGKSEFYQFMETEKLDEELLREAGRDFDAELVLLIVSGEHKGFGIGGHLYQNFLSYLEKEGLKSFYLFTDSSCDYGFYEQKKLTRIGQKTFYWEENAELESEEDFAEEYYLYCN